MEMKRHTNFPETHFKWRNNEYQRTHSGKWLVYTGQSYEQVTGGLHQILEREYKQLQSENE